MLWTDSLEKKKRKNLSAWLILLWNRGGRQLWGWPFTCNCPFHLHGRVRRGWASSSVSTTSYFLLFKFFIHIREGRDSLFFFFFFFFFVFLGPNLRHMEVPRLGVKSGLQLPVYATATAMQGLSQVCDLHHSSWQWQILNPLSKGRDRTRILKDSSWILLSHNGNSEIPSILHTLVGGNGFAYAIPLVWNVCLPHAQQHLRSLYSFRHCQIFTLDSHLSPEGNLDLIQMCSLIPQHPWASGKAGPTATPRDGHEWLMIMTGLEGLVKGLGNRQDGLRQ